MTIRDKAVRLIRKLYSLRDLNVSPVAKNRKVTAILSSEPILSRIIVFCPQQSRNVVTLSCKRNSLLQDDDNTQILSFFLSMILPKYPSSFFLANSASIKSSSVKSARARFLRFSSAAGPYKCEVW